MNRDQSRRECEILVAAVELPIPFDLAEMCMRLGGQRGKPIMLMATSMAMSTLCGLWLGTAKANYVFYEQDTSALHQQHIVFHEIGHILRCHAPRHILGADIARILVPDVGPGEVQRVLGRDTYNDDDEYEAELIATLLLRRVGRLSAAPAGPTDAAHAQDQGQAARVERALRRPGRR
jgi:hypothetical protein